MRPDCCHMARHHRAGLTLVELLLALAITGVIGLTVTGIVQATSYGTKTDAELRSFVVRHAVLSNRLTAAVRSSRLVLGHGDGYIILWLRDSRENDLPNLSELMLIEHHDETNRIYCYRGTIPDVLSAIEQETADLPYELTSNFESITSTLKSGDYFEGELWADNVTECEIKLDMVNPQLARLVSFRITTTLGEKSDVTVGAAALRTPLE